MKITPVDRKRNGRLSVTLNTAMDLAAVFPRAREQPCCLSAGEVSLLGERAGPNRAFQDLEQLDGMVVLISQIISKILGLPITPVRFQIIVQCKEIS